MPSCWKRFALALALGATLCTTAAAKTLRLSLHSANRLRASNKKIGLDYKLQRFLHGTLLDERSSHVFWNGTFSQEQRRATTAEKRSR